MCGPRKMILNLVSKKESTNNQKRSVSIKIGQGLFVETQKPFASVWGET